VCPPTTEQWGAASNPAEHTPKSCIGVDDDLTATKPVQTNQPHETPDQQLSAVASAASESHHEEAFYVLKGELTVRMGQQKLYKLLLTLDTVVASGYRLWHHHCGVGSSL
jgi:hypothetical protein